MNPMESTNALRELYEALPYPSPEDAVETVAGVAAGTDGVCLGYASAPFTYLPTRPVGEPLRILVAGCGTVLGAATAASHPESRVVALDISESSLAISRQAAEAAGCTNIEHRHGSLLELDPLDETYDLVVCTGVLHHLADPVEGLRCISSVTRPNGAIHVMVYGAHGRTGVYLLQDLFRTMGLRADRASVEVVKTILPAVPERHPMRQMWPHLGGDCPAEELADVFLNPVDRAFTVEDVRALIDSAGMKFHRWVGQAPYHPEISALRGPLADIADPWTRYRAMEQFRGDMIQHAFVVTHPEIPSADELIADRGWLNATWRAHPQVEVAMDGHQAVLTNGGHWRSVPVRANARAVRGLLAGGDGSTTFAQAIARGQIALPNASAAANLGALVRVLYLADIIDLGWPGPPTP